MKIGLFTDTYLPDINGVVTSIKNLKQGLEELGHKVYVITAHKSFFKVVLEDNILKMPAVEIKKVFGYKLAKPFSIRSYKIIKNLNLDIIHIHTDFTIGFFGRIVAKMQKIPLVWTYHTLYEDYIHYANDILNKPHIWKKASHKFSKIVANDFSNAIIAPTIKIKNLLRSYGTEKYIDVIPSGINLLKFKVIDIYHKEINEIKNVYGLHNKTVFLVLGRLAIEKNIGFIIENFPEVKTNISNAHLLIVGSGPELDKLKQYVVKHNLAEYVSFTGGIDNDIIPLIYQSAHIIINNSTSETQGLTIIEALAAGKPVLSRYDSCHKGVIIENETGFIFADKNVFIEKCIYFAKLNQLDKLKLQKQALLMSDNFSIDKYAQAVELVYVRVLNIKK